MSQFFAPGGQSIGVSASTTVLPMKTQHWTEYWSLSFSLSIGRLDPATSFFPELLVIVLHFPRSRLDPFQPGGLIFRCRIFCLFVLFMGFSWQASRSGLPFPTPVDPVLSELSTMTHPSWVGPRGVAHSFTESHKLLPHDKAVIREGI